MSAEVSPIHPLSPGPFSSPSPVLRVGLLGCGVVGSSVARILLDQAEPVSAACGTKLELGRVAVRDPFKERPVTLPAGVLTDDAYSVVNDPTIDIIVEVIGGIELPKDLILAALASGKSVVTANKELLACHGQTLAVAAEDAQRDLFFEASVGAAIPVLSALRGPLSADRVTRVAGVVNGTTNYLLERMAAVGSNLGEALQDAQRLGYAEADPRLDLSGEDAAAKIAILASLAFGGWVTTSEVTRAGMESVSPADVFCAGRIGYSVKLLAVAERTGRRVSLWVKPALVSKDSTLGSLPGVLNAVQLRYDNAGPVEFQGPGAGGDPSASAVVGDLVTVARNRLADRRAPLIARRGEFKTVLSPAAAPARYFLRLNVGGSTRPRELIRRALEDLGVPVEALTSVSSHGEANVALITGAVGVGERRRVEDFLRGSGLRLENVLPIVEVK